MAASKNGGSSDARWFALGVLVVGGGIALAAWNHGGRPSIGSLTGSDDPSVVADRAVDDAIAKSEHEAPEAKTKEPVFARGLKKVEPEILADRDRTADELLTSAREAWKRGRSTDAYRYATLSLRKKRTKAAFEIKAKAACRLGAKPAAKAAARELDGSRRRGVRRECRKHGIWLAL